MSITYSSFLKDLSIFYFTCLSVWVDQIDHANLNLDSIKIRIRLTVNFNLRSITLLILITRFNRPFCMAKPYDFYAYAVRMFTQFCALTITIKFHPTRWQNVNKCSLCAILFWRENKRVKRLYGPADGWEDAVCVFSSVLFISQHILSQDYSCAHVLKQPRTKWSSNGSQSGRNSALLQNDLEATTSGFKSSIIYSVSGQL